MKKNFCLKVCSLVLVLCMIFISISSFAAGGEWFEEDGKWKYKKNGNTLVNEWENIDGKDYYFNYDGSMAVGVVEIGSKYHAFNTDGTPYALGSSIKIMGKTCPIGTKGLIKNLPDDFSEEAMIEYNNTVAANKEEESKMKEQEAAMRAAMKAAAETATTVPTTKPITPIGDAAYETTKAAVVSNGTGVSNAYKITAADDQKLINACNSGNYTQAAKQLIAEMNTQLTNIQLNYFQEAKAKMTSNQKGLEQGTYIAKFDEVLNAYGERGRDLLDMIQKKYHVNDTKFEKIRDDFESALEKAKNKFDDTINKQQ